MTKIFITIPWFLPAFRAGGPVQSIANLVKQYNDDVQYFIFCSDTDLNGAALENIITGKWVKFNEHTLVWYANHEKISDSLVKQVETVKPDVLYIIGIYSWHFNIVPLLYCKAPKKILSTRGMLHPGALSQKKWKKKIYFGIFKLMEYQHKVQFHATDEEEQKYISNYFGKEAVISVAGNFANTISLLPLADKNPGVLKMISIALLSPMKNILKVLQALEKVKDTIQYDIYGPVKDHDYLKLCKEQVKLLPGNIAVNWHGEVDPAAVVNVLAHAHIFILPSKSENFGHAIYEALSAGRPVITSHHTPWQNLMPSKAGINIESPLELKDAILFFASMDSNELAHWSRKSREYAEKAVDVDNTREQYEKMFFGAARKA